MRLVLKTAPAAEPVLLADAKSHCRIDVNDDDALITAMIVAARTHAENFTQRAFINQDWYLYLSPEDFCGKGRGIKLPKQPVSAVASVEYQNPVGTWNPWAAANYVFDAPTHLLFPVFGQIWPIPAMPGTSGIRVTFTAGYGGAGANVPEAIKLAIKTLVLHMYENRAAYDAGSLNGVPAAFESLLFPYKLLDYGS